MNPLFSDLLAGPVLFVALLAVVTLLLPVYFLVQALRERGVFDRLFAE